MVGRHGGCMSVRNLRIILIFCILALLICASRPLICWTIGWDLQWHRCKSVWSTEFDIRPINEIILTATPTVFIEPTATLDWFPLPYVTPTVTPYLPTTPTMDWPPLPYVTQTVLPYPVPYPME